METSNMTFENDARRGAFLKLTYRRARLSTLRLALIFQEHKVKKFTIRLFSLIIGCFGFCLLAFSSEHAADSVFGFAILAVVNVAFVSYGLGGNAALSELPFMKIFSTPMTKKHLKNMVNSSGRGDA
jgi:hypothetical protein